MRSRVHRRFRERPRSESFCEPNVPARRQIRRAERHFEHRQSAKTGPEADVAVALAYLPGNDDAPRVIAKGKGGAVAQSIIDIARANGVADRKA